MTFHLVPGGGYAVYPPGATFGPRQTVNYEWVLILEGEVQWQCDATNYAAPPGTLILVPPGVQDRFVWDARQQTRHAYVHFEYSGTVPGCGPAATWPRLRHLPAQEVLRPLLQHLIHLNAQGAAPALEAQRQTTALLLLQAFCSGAVAATSQQPAHLPAPVERVFAWIARQWASQPLATLSLAAMAHAAGVSEVHLCRLFRQTFGLRPGQVVRLNRLHRGAVLLAHSNLGIKEIAALTGFATAFHFSRCFHAAYGLAPRAYRLAVLGGQPVRQPHAPLIDHTRVGGAG